MYGAGAVVSIRYSLPSALVTMTWPLTKTGDCSAAVPHDTGKFVVSCDADDVFGVDHPPDVTGRVAEEQLVRCRSPDTAMT